MIAIPVPRGVSNSDDAMEAFVHTDKFVLLNRIQRMTMSTKELTPEQKTRAEEILKTRKLIVVTGGSFPPQYDQHGPPLVKATPKLESPDPDIGECAVHLAPSHGAIEKMKESISSGVPMYPYRTSSIRVGVNLSIGTVDEIIAQFAKNLRAAAIRVVTETACGTFDNVETWNKQVDEAYPPAKANKESGTFDMVREDHPKLRGIRRLQSDCMDACEANAK